jgi:hypothetical protein
MERETITRPPLEEIDADADYEILDADLDDDEFEEEDT